MSSRTGSRVAGAGTGAGLPDRAGPGVLASSRASARPPPRTSRAVSPRRWVRCGTPPTSVRTGRPDCRVAGAASLAADVGAVSLGAEIGAGRGAASCTAFTVGAAGRERWRGPCVQATIAITRPATTRIPMATASGGSRRRLRRRSRFGAVVAASAAGSDVLWRSMRSATVITTGQPLAPGAWRSCAHPDRAHPRSTQSPQVAGRAAAAPGTQRAVSACPGHPDRAASTSAARLGAAAAADRAGNVPGRDEPSAGADAGVARPPVRCAVGRTATAPLRIHRNGHARLRRDCPGCAGTDPACPPAVWSST